MAADDPAAEDAARNLPGSILSAAAGPASAAAAHESVIEVCPPFRTTTEQMLLRGEADSAWMYLCWEVLRAERAATSTVGSAEEVGEGKRLPTCVFPVLH